MALDPSTHKDPSIFDPARFLPETDGGRGEPLFEPAFGFGRRYADERQQVFIFTSWPHGPLGFVLADISQTPVSSSPLLPSSRR